MYLIYFLIHRFRCLVDIVDCVIEAFRYIEDETLALTCLFSELFLITCGTVALLTVGYAVAHGMTLRTIFSLGCQVCGYVPTLQLHMKFYATLFTEAT